MEIVNLSLPATNRFASNYLQQSAEIQSFFHYRYNQQSDDLERLAELNNRSFPRKEIAGHIQKYMERFPHSPAISHSIEKLTQSNSVVVIGGQQAGILTGPLYTLHKVISIIKLAEEKEKELHVPVVPVFWIAGEDHDYQEVNHVYIENGNKAEKWVYPEKNTAKKMVSDVSLNKQMALSWISEIIAKFGETDYTNSLRIFAENLLGKSVTFVDFFANIIMELFKDYGLLVLDSGDRDLRQIEKEILLKQITHHRSITAALLEQQKQIRGKGFSNAIETNDAAANLFFYDQRRNERILLEFDSRQGVFTGKNGIIFSEDELAEIADKSPGFLSNNVVTRPLTQEMLFPAIAFIAGPGEIAYWAELKLVFEHFGIKMPPIVPRLNITLLECSIESDINELHLSLEEVLSRGTKTEKENFLSSIKDNEAAEVFSVTKELLQSQYRRIEEKTAELDRGLLPLLKKNEQILINQVDFMQAKLEESLRFRHQVTLNKYDRIDLSLRPGGSPQERVWNIFYYLNKHGLGLVKNLMELPYKFDGTHKVIKV
jgi:bacillithiol biosynthesis cysteine-adding enzyme BshC